MYNNYIFINNKRKEIAERKNNSKQISFDMILKENKELTNNYENKIKNENAEESKLNKINFETQKIFREDYNPNNKKGKNLIEFVDDYVLVDIETTGLSPINDDIIEIGAIKVKNNKIIDTYNELIKIDRNLLPFIINLTGITDEMLKKGKMPNIVYKDFINFIGDNIIIGHNINFDLGFLCNKCKKYLNYNIPNDYIDTMYIARKLVPNCINYKLGTLAKLFNISYEGAHRGLKDVEITYEVYNNLKNIKI